MMAKNEPAMGINMHMYKQRGKYCVGKAVYSTRIV